MTDPLRVPEAVREAVRVVLAYMESCEPEYRLPDREADVIARAVLTAALKAEWEGPWECFEVKVGSGDWFIRDTSRPTVSLFSMTAPGIIGMTEAEARAVAAALNITQGGERDG